MFRRQIGQHLSRCFAKNRMAPSRCDLGHRRQHKPALMHAGMRQNQQIWWRLIDRCKAQRHQSFEFVDIRFNGLAISDQIKIADPRLPPLFPSSAEFNLNSMESSKQIRWRQIT